MMNLYNILKLLKDAFKAGEDYNNSGEFAYYAPTFEEWFLSIEKDLAKQNANEIIDLIRFVIKNWASFNEQAEPDHELLIQNFIKNELMEYFTKCQTKLE